MAEADPTDEQREAQSTAATPEVAPAAQPEPADEAVAAEVPAPKDRRRRARTARAAKIPVGAPRTPQQRHEQRVTDRARKAEIRRAGRLRARAKARASTSDSVRVAPREHQPGAQKTRQGVVVSDRAEKTITVRIDTARRHRSYAKVVRTSSTVHAHDELDEAHAGDTVIVRESRPLSRTKRWRLVEVVERAK